MKWNEIDRRKLILIGILTILFVSSFVLGFAIANNLWVGRYNSLVNECNSLVSEILDSKPASDYCSNPFYNSSSNAYYCDIDDVRVVE
jgi:hypothetical protein